MRGISQCKTWDSQLGDEKFRSGPEFHSARPNGKKVGTSVRKAKSGWSEEKTSRARRLGRRAFGAAVADRIEHLGDGDRCRLR